MSLALQALSAIRRVNESDAVEINSHEDADKITSSKRPQDDAKFQAFAEEAQAYNNTHVYWWNDAVWVDSLKRPSVFGQMARKHGLHIKVERELSPDEEKAAWSGEGPEPKHKVMIGKHEGLGHIMVVS